MSVRSWSRSTGRTALTTLPSSAAMKVPVPMATSTHHLRGTFARATGISWSARMRAAAYPMAVSDRMTPATPVARVEVGSFRRDGVEILREVRWTIRAGEHWVLLGPNGSGKTSLLRILAAYEWPSQGEVEVLGEKFGRFDLRELRKRIGLVCSALAPRFPEWDDARAIVLSGIDAAIRRAVRRRAPAGADRARLPARARTAGPGRAVRRARPARAGAPARGPGPLRRAPGRADHGAGDAPPGGDPALRLARAAPRQRRRGRHRAGRGGGDRPAPVARLRRALRGEGGAVAPVLAPLPRLIVHSASEDEPPWSPSLFRVGFRCAGRRSRWEEKRHLSLQAVWRSRDSREVGRPAVCAVPLLTRRVPPRGGTQCVKGAALACELSSLAAAPLDGAARYHRTSYVCESIVIDRSGASF